MRDVSNASADRVRFLRWLLLPRPFSGLAIWLCMGCGVTAWLMAKPRLSEPRATAAHGEDGNVASPSPATTSVPDVPSDDSMIVRTGIRTDADRDPEHQWGPPEGAPLPYPTEIITWESEYVLKQEHAYRLGDQLEFDNDRVHVRVTEERSSEGVLVVTIGSGDGFCWTKATLKFEREGQRVTADVEDFADGRPELPPAWRSVNGSVRLSSWTLRAPLGIEFELFGWKYWRNQSWSTRIFLDK
jgi:hypothetical protein